MAFDDRPQQLVSLTAYLLSQVAKIAKNELDDQLSRRGLRLRHMAVLAVAGEGPVSQLELTRRLNIDPSDVTATVDDLENAALVARTVDPTDRRRRLVTMTAGGRREMARLTAMAQQIADALLEPVPPRRRQQLHDDLRRVLLAHDDRQDQPDA